MDPHNILYSVYIVWVHWLIRLLLSTMHGDNIRLLKNAVQCKTAQSCKTAFSRTIYDIAILDSIVLHGQKYFFLESVNIFNASRY